MSELEEIEKDLLNLKDQLCYLEKGIKEGEALFRKHQLKARLVDKNMMAVKLDVLACKEQIRETEIKIQQEKTKKAIKEGLEQSAKGEVE